MGKEKQGNSPSNSLESPVLLKEIDLVQNCISRMARNSFLLKGWTVSLIGAIFVFSSGNLNAKVLFLIAALTSFVTLVFWYLDAFFLHQERLYRKLYEWLLTVRPCGNYERAYDLNASRFSSEVDNISKVMWSKTLRAFYGSITLAALTLLFGILLFWITKFILEILFQC